MNNTDTQTNCLPFNYLSDLHNLCKPLLLNTNIASFHYVRTYSNGGYVSLNTDMEIEKFILTQNNGKFMYDVRIIDSLFSNKKFSKNKCDNRLCLFTEDIDQGYWSSMFQKFNIKSCFNVIEKNDSYYDRFGFRNRFDKISYGFYVNNLNVLEKFILYFKEYGSHLIRDSEKNKIIWFNNNPQYNDLVKNLKEVCGVESNSIEALIGHYKIKKYPISNNSIKSYLTQHELKCLQHLGKGFTCKEIGNTLHISYRTVETHLRNIKSKLNIYSLDQLLKIYHSSVLADL